MEYFMLLATDAEDVHEARMAARPAHLARLEELKAQGRCLPAPILYQIIRNAFPAA